MQLKDKNVLITGADGFIGSHLVEGLIRQGCKVKALVYYNSFGRWGWLDTLPKSTLSKVDIIAGDVRDSGCIDEASRGIDCVFHLAALISIPYSYLAPESYIDTNVKGTLNILQSARRHDVKKVIVTSTSEVYGTAQQVPINEFHPINPQSPYAASKSAADQLAISFYRSFDLPVTVLRPFNTFGPRQSARAIIPTVITQILAGHQTIQLGNIHATRDLNYVGNTVDAYIALAKSDKGLGEVFNAGSGLEVSIEEVVSRIKHILKSKAKIVVDKKRLRPSKSEVERLVCDSNRLMVLTGWRPKVDLHEGLSLTCQWLKENLNTYKPDEYHV